MIHGFVFSYETVLKLLLTFCSDLSNFIFYFCLSQKERLKSLICWEKRKIAGDVLVSYDVKHSIKQSHAAQNMNNKNVIEIRNITMWCGFFFSQKKNLAFFYSMAFNLQSVNKRILFEKKMRVLGTYRSSSVNTGGPLCLWISASVWTPTMSLSPSALAWRNEFAWPKWTIS